MNIEKGPSFGERKEINSITELAEILRNLNPDVNISLGEVGEDPKAAETIYSSEPIEGLSLPEGFYCNEKNGLTNKHNTETGQYISVRVEKLD